MSSFAKASAATPLGDGRYEIQIDPDRFGAGPHRRSLAAASPRSLGAHVGDPDRHPLSLTCHFLRGLSAGPAIVTVTTERIGRGVTALSARMAQGEDTGVLALATFGVEREGTIDFDSPGPAVPRPAGVE